MRSSAKRTHSSKKHWAAWLNILLAVLGLWLLVEIVTIPPTAFKGEIRLPVSITTSVAEKKTASQQVFAKENRIEVLKKTDFSMDDESVPRKTRSLKLKDKIAVRKAIPPSEGLPSLDNNASFQKSDRTAALKNKTTAPSATPPPSSLSERVRISISDKIAKLRSPTGPLTKYVSVWTVNLRREPNNYSAVLSKLRWGQKVTVLEERDHWEKIETEDGLRGWGHKVLLEDEPPSLEKIAGLKGVVETIRVQMDGARACTIFIDLDADQPPETQVLEGEEPRLVSDFNLMMADPKIAPTISVRNGVINAIRVGIADETNLTTRVEVDLIPGVDYVVDQVFYQEEQTYALHIKAKKKV